MLLFRLAILGGCITMAGGNYAVDLITNETARLQARSIVEVLFTVAAITIFANTTYHLIERRVISNLRATWRSIHAHDGDGTRE